MLKSYNLLNIGFPIYLVLFEVLLRTFSSVDTSSFIGPTLAASGLGLIIGVLKPKTIKLDQTTQHSLKEMGLSAIVRDSKDEKIVFLGWVAILVELLTWYWSCAVAIKTGDKEQAKSIQPLIIGVVNYIIGVILLSFKEAE